MRFLLDSGWRNWYRAQHDSRWASCNGTEFESYFKSALKLFDDGFIDPDAMGSLGDGGCDGISGDGKTLYACYGSSSKTNGESKLVDKLRADFDKAIDGWPGITAWQFVTNAKFGPNATKLIVELRDKHAPDSDRPISIGVWKEADDFWTNVLSHLASDKLDVLFPGVPHVQSIELADFVELLDSLKDVAPNPGETATRISPVAETKMDYNGIPPAVRLEFNSARSCVHRIDEWFDRQSDPTLRDKKALAFNQIYQAAKKAHSDPQEIVEEVYTALGGSDFRLDAKRANAVYVVTTYFFDTCDIFENPPAGYGKERQGE